MQREIIAEIESYQKIINGARAVLENYHPHIPIKPEWPTVNLADATELISGFAFKSSNMVENAKDTTYLPVVKIGNVGRNGTLDLAETQFHKFDDSLSRFLLKVGDIVVAMTGATVGKVARVNKSNLLLNQRVGALERREI